MLKVFVFFNDTATTEIYTLSLHDALPICSERELELSEEHDGIIDLPETVLADAPVGSSMMQIGRAHV